MKLYHDKLLSTFAFNCNLRRYKEAFEFKQHAIATGALLPTGGARGGAAGSSGRGAGGAGGSDHASIVAANAAALSAAADAKAGRCRLTPGLHS